MLPPEMVFSSPTFLFLFLPITLLAHLAVPARWRNHCLLLASMVFYVWGSGGQVLVLLYVSILSFTGVRLARRVAERTEQSEKSESAPPASRFAVAVLILMLLGPILLYKYVPPVADLVRSTAWPGAPTLNLALPLGISFFTFHAISYVVDAGRGGLPPERSLKDYLLYLFLFPHQIAGPIVRYAEIVTELKGRREVTLPNAAYGLTRFAWGLAKKAFVADSAGVIADAAFGGPAVTMNTATAWIGALAYAIQIYFDFSGYSDMAIGLAALFGFRFPENFRSPYRSLGPADFWRRWHMTLSRWFRDYVYIPLGGNRRGPRREYAALLITFGLTSLWHGATWPFLAWGGLHSLALVVERVSGLRTGESWPGLRRTAMVVFIVISWVPFRSPTLGHAVDIWRSMVTGGLGAPSPEVLITLTPWTGLALLVGLSSFVGPRDITGFQQVHGDYVRFDRRTRFRLQRAVLTAPLLLSVAVISVLWLDFSPFLYFQF
jgi:alginate O-acetyltransferase complex protein AlgI